MKVKKYMVTSMAEARDQIQAELGHDAVILHSKEVETGGFLGFFTKRKFEVIAAIDPKPPQKRKPTLEVPVKQEETQPIVPLKKETTGAISEEISAIKEMIEQMSSGYKASEYPDGIDELSKELITHGVSDSIRYRLMKKLMEQYVITVDQSSSLHKKEKWREQLKGLLLNELQSYPIEAIPFNKQVLQLVGPTGVGKTTTIAKLAAEATLKKQLKVALITTDTYRIAAVEQLKTYAKILELPLEVAYTIDDLQKAKERFKEYDLIMIDSAGRNFTDKAYVEELSKVIDFQAEATTCLVLSLTSKYEDMKKIIEQFSLVQMEQVIFTKLDETTSLGALLNIPLEKKLGIAYISNGQNVPDDLFTPTASFIVEQVLRGTEHD
ncbi:flagellar biosynthesis protein FlhF [Alkalihalobacillus sp. 1P02AB]|uniref:flagellar biosynthesis protein FlhF n=1 Tax=Alkalihalobacillus sp. 1P02AB TaxID=3132260 RepID=UPI0039A49ECC